LGQTVNLVALPE